MVVTRHFARMVLVLLGAAGTYAFAEGRRIVQLTVLQSGVSQNETEPLSAAFCKNFKPTAQQVRNFFQKAVPVPGAYMADSLYSECYASGTVEFDDEKSTGRWILYSTGVARLDWDWGGAVYLLHLANTWQDPMHQ
jgi:hypothetical protein